MSKRDAAYQKRWKYQAAHGIKQNVDPTECQNLIDSLIGAGWSLRSIAGEAGVSVQAISHLRNRSQKWVTRKIAVKILAIDPDKVPAKTDGRGEPFVSRIGTQRRMQALLFMGWPWSVLRTYGLNPATLSQQGRWVTRTTHDRVAQVYGELGHRVGPSERSRRYAVKHGYLGPLHWEDIDIDAEPLVEVVEDEDDEYLDEAAIMRRMGGERGIRVTKDEAAELVRRWHASGRSLSDCERVTGIKPDRHFHLSDLEQEATA